METGMYACMCSYLPMYLEARFHSPKLSPHCALTSKMVVVCGMSPESLLRTTQAVDLSTLISW